MNRQIGLGISVVLFVVVVAMGWGQLKLMDKVEVLNEKVAQLEKKGPAVARPQAPPAQEKAYDIPVGKSAVLGNSNADVSVTIFSDAQCPFCAGADKLMRDAIKDPALKGKVKVIFKHFPLSFHPNAKPAAKAALAAKEQGEAKFWEMMDKSFANQRDLTPENFKKWAKEIGLNVPQFEKDLKKNDNQYETIIQADMDLGTKKANVRGTPSIYVDGWELRERSLQGIKNLIKEKNL